MSHYSSYDNIRQYMSYKVSRCWASRYALQLLPRIHQSSRVTPAIKAGVSDHVWSLDEVIALL